jgi:serine/threonine protein kinase
MAPEQCLPDGPVKPGAASDVWGIGATLFRAVAGERPFAHPQRDVSEPTERWPQLQTPPRELPDHVGAAVAEPVMACLEADPSLRPSAGELCDRLEPVLGALPKPRLSRLKPRVQR